MENYFCGSKLDRLSEKRNDSAFIAHTLTKDNSRFFIFKDLNPLALKTTNDHLHSYTLQAFDNKKALSFFENSPLLCGKLENQVADIFIKEGLLIFLGTSKLLKNVADLELPNNESNEESVYHFALDVTQCTEQVNQIISSSNDNSKFLSSRTDVFMLNPDDAAIVAQSRSIFDWHKRYLFCPTCGSRTIADDVGYKRTCTNHNCITNKGIYNTNYPRTDPVVISVVVSSDRTKVLLGRKTRFPVNMYSCLAGFMEPGESIEEAARREIKEESGIDVDKVLYISSQPWPYPSVLMIGCISWAINEEIKICTEELEDVKWFEVKDVQDALHNRSSLLSIPPPQTIAHQLIKHWLSSQLNIINESKM